VLEVVLVNARHAARPQKADASRRRTSEGGGNTDKKMRAATPFRRRSRASRARAQGRRGAREAARGRVARAHAAAKSKAAVSPVQPQQEARDIVERNLEIERLEAQIRREHQAYQERPRKKFIGARTEEYRYAVYIDRWRQKIERIGTLNYPAEARAKGIYASLQLTVGIKQTGEIESIELNRSSGYKFLDRAAERIVRLASPFEPFPKDIKSEWDILYITRTYTFTRADEVVTTQ
jgi:protein TonB